MRDLRHWHIVTAECLQFRYTIKLTSDFLAWERSPHTSLTDLQRKLRCTRCGNRQGNTLSVRRAPRE